MKLKSLLKSKLVLYTTFVVAILHVLGYIAVDDDKALLFFIALGVLTTFFSKNMIIVLVVAIVGTNVLFAGNAVQEGLTNAQAVEEKEEKEKKQKGSRVGGRALPVHVWVVERVVACLDYVFLLYEIVVEKLG